MRTGLSSNSGEPHCQGTLLALLREHIGKAELRDRVGTLKEPVGAGTLGVDDALGDPLAIKVRQHINQVEVLQQQRTALAGPLGLVRMRLGSAIAGGVGDLGRRLGPVLLGAAELVGHEGLEAGVCSGGRHNELLH